MIKELDSVVLTTDLPDLGLRQGDLGTVVLVHREGGAYEVEFTQYRTVTCGLHRETNWVGMTLDGETLAVVTLLVEQVRPINRREIAHARAVAI